MDNDIAVPITVYIEIPKDMQVRGGRVPRHPVAFRIDDSHLESLTTAERELLARAIVGENQVTARVVANASDWPAARTVRISRARERPDRRHVNTKIAGM